MEHSELSFIPLMIVLGIAFVIPILITRIKKVFIPVIIGEVIAGMAVGKSGLGFVEQNQVLKILSDLGFVYLMFLSGLEIQFSGILKTVGTGKKKTLARKIFGNYLSLAVILFILTFILSAGFGWALKIQGLVRDHWIMALILSTTSLGVVVPVLKEKELTTKESGQVILVSAMVADFASIFLISVYVLIHNEGLSNNVLLVLLLLAAFAGVYRMAFLFQKHMPAKRIVDNLSSATSQLRIRGSLALALIFVVLAQSLGTENILGAFLAGVIVSLLTGEESSILREKLDAIGYGFFIPIFFIMVGVNFDLPAVLSSRSALIVLPLFVAAAYVVKILPALIFITVLNWRQTLASGALLSARLSLIIAASAVGFRLGVISEAVNSAMILVAVITCTISPILFNFLAPIPVKEKDLAIVIGCRKYAELFHKRLLQQGLEAKLLCTDFESKKGVILPSMPKSGIRGALASELKKAGIQKASYVIAMTESDDDNLLICRMAKIIFSVGRVISWVKDPLRNREFRSFGAQIVNPSYSSLLLMESLIMNPQAIGTNTDVDEAFEIREVKLKGDRYEGVPINDLDLYGDTSVLMIHRKEDFFVPDRNTTIRTNDSVVLAGTEEDLMRTLQMLKPKEERAQASAQLHQEDKN